jgi:hypothetical protein
MSCNKYNIIWVERGIILSIIDYITQNYKKIQNKNIIIENIRYQTFIKILFPELIFKPINHKSKNNFYFNIRKIIKKQDVIIDYLNNHNTINGKNIDLIPYYDYNDILVRFEVNKNKIDTSEFISTFYSFHHQQRCNFNNKNYIWDLYREKQIIINYIKKIYSKKKFDDIFNFLNKFFQKNIIREDNTKLIPIPLPIIKYISKDTDKENTSKVNSTDLNNFIKVITNKIKLINDIIE